MTQFADRGDYLPATSGRDSTGSRRSLQRALQRTDQAALVRAREVQAAGFVATVALHEIHGVASLASEYARVDPCGAGAYAHIVQRAAIAMGGQI